MDRIDPYFSYNFAVELDGITRAGFRDCSGLDSNQNGTEYREGTDRNLAPRKLPGLNTYGDITLSRGITNDSKLWEWRQRVMKGNVDRHNVSIILLDQQGNPKVTWNLFECWPKAWQGPSLNATSDEIAVEQITLACERIEVDEWS